MLDTRYIGNRGLILDYEDIVCMIGVNVLMHFYEKDKNIVKGISSFEEILSSYLQRKDEDFSLWLSSHGIDGFNIKEFMESPSMLKPTLLYAYKLIPNAVKSGIKDIYIHSEFESNMIKRIIGEGFPAEVNYVYGDIRDIMDNTKCNFTYLTASPTNVRRCLDIKVPFALTICDDYMSMLPIIQEHLDDTLRDNNKFVAYTSIISAGGN